MTADPEIDYEGDGPGEGEAPPGDPPSRARMILLAVAVLVVAVGLAYALYTLRARPERTEPEVVPPVVETVTARPETVRFSVRSQGTVRPTTESALAAEVAGRVVSVSPKLREGAFFERGEVLVTLDPADYRLALRDAEAAVEQARARLQRVEAEAEVAREELDTLDPGRDATPLARYEPQLAEARAGLEAAEGARERSRLALERTTIEAPYAGRVRSRQVDVGQVVAPGTPVATVFGTEAAEVELPVTKEEAGYLGTALAFGDAVTPDLRIELEAELGGVTHRWPATLVRTGGEIAPRTRMVSLFARVDDPYRREPGAAGPPLPPGLFVEARIPGREVEGAYALPPSALSSGGTLYVVDAEDRLRFRQVEVLRATEDRIVVGKGLEPGERVVVSRLDTVTDGMRVRTAAETETAGAGEGTE